MEFGRRLETGQTGGDVGVTTVRGTPGFEFGRRLETGQTGGDAMGRSLGVQRFGRTGSDDSEFGRVMSAASTQCARSLSQESLMPSGRFQWEPAKTVTMKV